MDPSQPRRSGYHRVFPACTPRAESGRRPPSRTTGLGDIWQGTAHGPPAERERKASPIASTGFPSTAGETRVRPTATSGDTRRGRYVQFRIATCFSCVDHLGLQGFIDLLTSMPKSNHRIRYICTVQCYLNPIWILAQHGGILYCKKQLSTSTILRMKRLCRPDRNRPRSVGLLATAP